VDWWQPVNDVIYFKRRVYLRALREFGRLVFPDGPPPRPESDAGQRAG
jgi:putative (di)nucleoside polyphosphate hydrolase